MRTALRKSVKTATIGCLAVLSLLSLYYLNGGDFSMIDSSLADHGEVMDVKLTKTFLHVLKEAALAVF